jgi:hypothetical protein
MLIFILLVSIHLTSWMGDGQYFQYQMVFEASTCHYQWWENGFIS